MLSTFAKLQLYIELLCRSLKSVKLVFDSSLLFLHILYEGHAINFESRNLKIRNCRFWKSYNRLNQEHLPKIPYLYGDAKYFHTAIFLVASEYV